ncbi:hypothetical protein Syun_020930 [Stephania yunnanensis]|uniref:Uncharacterized protein n=1 Tax=Stephania yunnanensis TaxID=152371 RepID=A0AAP0IEV2_9MAGN
MAPTLLIHIASVSFTGAALPPFKVVVLLVEVDDLLVIVVLNPFSSKLRVLRLRGHLQYGTFGGFSQVSFRLEMALEEDIPELLNRCTMSREEEEEVKIIDKLKGDQAGLCKRIIFGSLASHQNFNKGGKVTHKSHFYDHYVEGQLEIQYISSMLAHSQGLRKKKSVSLQDYPTSGDESSRGEYERLRNYAPSRGVNEFSAIQKSRELMLREEVHKNDIETHKDRPVGKEKGHFMEHLINIVPDSPNQAGIIIDV